MFVKRQYSAKSFDCKRIPFVDRGTIEVLNPNGESGGGPFARGRARASAMGVWRTPKEEEYANPQGLVGRKVRVYFDGDCTFFEAKVHCCTATGCFMLHLSASQWYLSTFLGLERSVLVLLDVANGAIS